jgi:hypothetical protein
MMAIQRWATFRSRFRREQREPTREEMIQSRISAGAWMLQAMFSEVTDSEVVVNDVGHAVQFVLGFEGRPER